MVLVDEILAMDGVVVESCIVLIFQNHVYLHLKEMIVAL